MGTAASCLARPESKQQLCTDEDDPQRSSGAAESAQPQQPVRPPHVAASQIAQHSSAAGVAAPREASDGDAAPTQPAAELPQSPQQSPPLPPLSPPLSPPLLPLPRGEGGAATTQGTLAPQRPTRASLGRVCHNAPGPAMSIRQHYPLGMLTPPDIPLHSARAKCC